MTHTEQNLSLLVRGRLSFPQRRAAGFRFYQHEHESVALAFLVLRQSGIPAAAATTAKTFPLTAATPSRRTTTITPVNATAAASADSDSYTASTTTVARR